MKDTYKDDEFKKLRDIKVVSLDAMRKSFGTNPTWSNALGDDAKFLRFIKETCKGEADDIEADFLFNVQKIRCLALLWCDDDAKEKIGEFWNTLQDADQPTIAAGDKDFFIVMELLFEISTTYIWKYEEEYTGAKGQDIDQSEIEAAKENYEPLMEEFLNDVFGAEDQIEREEYMKKVLSSQSWIFKPMSIRKKLGYKTGENSGLLRSLTKGN